MNSRSRGYKEDYLELLWVASVKKNEAKTQNRVGQVYKVGKKQGEKIGQLCSNLVRSEIGCNKVIEGNFLSQIGKRVLLEHIVYYAQDEKFVS